MTDTPSSPFILLHTATGLVSIDVRTIAGNIVRDPSRPERVYLRSTITDPTTLHFASAEEADDAVAVLHAARELHSDERAEDARAKVVGEAIRESGREFTQQIADMFRQVAEGVQAMLTATLAATEASHRLGTPPRSSHEWGWLDAEAIITYDRERRRPSSDAIYTCIRRIADRPHRAPLYLAELVESATPASGPDVDFRIVGISDDCGPIDITVSMPSSVASMPYGLTRLVARGIIEALDVSERNDCFDVMINGGVSVPPGCPPQPVKTVEELAAEHVLELAYDEGFGGRYVLHRDGSLRSADYERDDDDGASL